MPAIVCGSAGIGSESSYFLDGCLSCIDMTPDVETFVRLSSFDLDTFLDNFQWAGNGASVCAQEIRSKYIEWRENVSPATRAACGLNILFGLGEQFREFRYNVSDNHVLQHMKTGDDISSSLIPIQLQESMNDRLSKWYDDVTQGMSWLQQDYAAADKTELTNIVHQYIDKPVVSYVPVVATRVPKRTIKKVRQAMKRSGEMMRQMVGNENMYSYINGRPFRLRGHLFDYVITKTQAIFEQTANPRGGHIPYDLAIYDNGERLCRLCIYFENTPVMDQIAAIAMYIKSGEEREMLQTANMFDRSLTFDEHPIMQELGKTRNVLSPNTTNLSLETLMGDFYYDGISSTVFNEQIVPWRARSLPAFEDMFSHRIGMNKRTFQRIVSADRMYDEMTYQERFPDQLIDFINHQWPEAT